MSTSYPASAQPSFPSSASAGFWRRFGAALLDGVILGIITVILYLLLRSVGYVLGFFLGIAYFSYFEGAPRGQTPGKSALAIRVASRDGGDPIGYGRAAVRYLGSILSGAVIYVGYLWMLWDPEKQTWHDKFARSLVVSANAYPRPA